MPFGVSLPELLILLVVLLLVFGAKRLPEMGRSLGKGMREFKDGVSGLDDSVTTTTPTQASSQELPTATSEPTVAAPTASAPVASAPAGQTERETVS